MTTLPQTATRARRRSYILTDAMATFRTWLSDILDRAARRIDVPASYWTEQR